MTKPEIGVYLPQMGFTYPDILHRALRCEELGIDSLWLYDHLYAPGAPDYPSMEAWTLATALLSRTERIQVGHMVLCNQFRHPAVLAKMATTLDQISAGRLQLGIGSGSIEDEHNRVGLDWGTFAQRSERLGETLEILHQAFADERIDLRRQAFHRAGHADQARSGSAAPAADRGRRCRREVHAAVGGALRRRVERAHVCARRARAQDVGAAWRSARTSAATRTPSCSRSRRSWRWRRTTRRCPGSGSSPRSVSGYRHSGCKEGGLIGTPQAIVDRLHELQALGFGQIVLFTHDRGSDETLELLASEVIARL